MLIRNEIFIILSDRDFFKYLVHVYSNIFDSNAATLDLQSFTYRCAGPKQLIRSESMSTVPYRVANLLQAQIIMGAAKIFLT